MPRTICVKECPAPAAKGYQPMKHAALMALLTGKTPLDVIAGPRQPRDEARSATVTNDAGANTGRSSLLKRLTFGILGRST
jgi:hypothetical protein